MIYNLKYKHRRVSNYLTHPDKINKSLCVCVVDKGGSNRFRKTLKKIDRIAGTKRVRTVCKIPAKGKAFFCHPYW